MAHHSSQRPIVQRISRKSRVNRSVMRAFRASQSSLGLQRGVSKPAEAAPETIVALQRTYGNRAVQRLTHDQLSEGGALDAPTSAAIERSQGGGQPLANAVRQPLEQAFQSDFSQVRVHADPQADRFNRSVQAEAFTLGHDIYFRKDNYAPSTTTGKKLIAHELTHVVQQTGQPAPAVQRAPAATATLPAPEELTSRIAHCIGIWETNRGKDDPAPRESSLDTVSGLHASMATIEQATMPYAITALKNHQTLRNKATPPLTLVELNAAEARCTAVVTLLSSVNTASAAGTTPDDFIKGHADAITATGLSNDDVKTMFSAVELKKTIDAAHARVEAETTDAAKKKKLEEETAAIPESDRLGLGTGSVKAYIRNTKNWGENRAAWQRKAVNAMPDNVGTRIQQVAVSDNGTALAIPVVRSRVDAQLAKTPVPSEEEIVKTVAQQNNPNETNYGQHVWETYTKHTWGTTATAQSSTSSAAPTEKSPETKTSSATPEKQTASSGNTTATTTTPSYAANASQYFNVANQITSIMEGGSTKGSYGALTTINDGGIISYGKHQATLSSGSLGSILNAYIASSTSANAEVIRKNITRVNQKDITLKDDKTFLEALRGAAGEKEMQVAQDLIFSQGYWDPAVKAAQKGSIQSPLGFAMLYDTKIQGGMEACMKKANEKCKGNVGDKVEGKAITELDFLKAFNDAREERLEAIAVAAEAAGELTKAKAVRGSKYRCRAFRALLEAGNLNVAGPEGQVEVLGPGGKAYKIEGFNTQASGTSTALQTGESKNKPTTSPKPNTPTVTATTGIAQVTTDVLNVRQGPDATTAKLGTLVRGTQVAVTGREGKWLRITYQGKPAFIHSDYAQFTPATTASKLNFVERTYQIGKGIFKEALDAGKDLWNWIAKQFDSSTNKSGPATNTAPSKTLAYESQRDNAYDQKDDNGERVYGGVMCNVTTLAMQLETLAGNKEKAIDAAVQLLQKNGETTPAPVLRQKQLEDLLMARFDQITKKNEWPTLLGKEYKQAAVWHLQKKIPWNQIATALNRVGLEFTAFIAKAEHNEPNDGKGNTQEKLTSEEYYRKTLGPITENQKATAMLSTAMTGGHIVFFAQALSDGVLINDPYGALLREAGASNYITNGLDKNTAAKRIQGAGDQVIKDRLKYNKAALNNLMNVIAPDNKSGAKVPQNIGELNFYTWSEIKKFTICKWNNILYKK